MLFKQLQLKAAAPTDIWRKPPSLDVANAPTQIWHFPSETFRRARVTVTAAWSRLYDQGGIYVAFTTLPGKGTSEGKRCWLKTGIEFYNDQANLSTVAAREWADWSLLPLPSNSVTIEIEREAGGTGPSLWVYLVDGEKRTAVREVTWAFELEGDIDVGVYAARPTEVDGEDGEQLVVTFDNFEIEYHGGTG